MKIFIIIIISLLSYNLYGASSDLKTQKQGNQNTIRIRKDLLIKGEAQENKSYYDILKKVSNFKKLEESIDLNDIEVQRANINFHFMSVDSKRLYFIKLISNKSLIEIFFLESKKTVFKKDFHVGYYDFQVVLFDSLSGKEVHKKQFQAGVLNNQKLSKSFLIRDGKINMRDEI